MSLYARCALPRSPLAHSVSATPSSAGRYDGFTASARRYALMAPDELPCARSTSPSPESASESLGLRATSAS